VERGSWPSPRSTVTPSPGWRARVSARVTSSGSSVLPSNHDCIRRSVRPHVRTYDICVLPSSIKRAGEISRETVSTRRTGLNTKAICYKAAPLGCSIGVYWASSLMQRLLRSAGPLSMSSGALPPLANLMRMCPSGGPWLAVTRLSHLVNILISNACRNAKEEIA
jgi:hypothetical protein